MGDYEDAMKKGIGERVQWLREHDNRQETQEGLSQAIDVSLSTIQKIEQGKIYMSIPCGVAIAKHYGANLDWIYGVTKSLDNSTKTLDCLNKYVKLSTRETQIGDVAKYRYRALYIDHNFARLLEHLRLIPTIGDILPEEMKSSLTEIEKQNFITSILSNTKQEFLEFSLLIPPTRNLNESEVPSESVLQLLERQLKVKLDKIETTSIVPSI